MLVVKERDLLYFRFRDSLRKVNANIKWWLWLRESDPEVSGGIDSTKDFQILKFRAYFFMEQNIVQRFAIQGSK
jgi:hypothetical protein